MYREGVSEGVGDVRQELDFIELSDTEKLLYRVGFTDRAGHLTPAGQELLLEWLAEGYQERFIEAAKKLEASRRG